MFVVLVSITLAAAADAPKEAKLKPTLIFTGTHSAIHFETFDLIATEEGWKELWKKHRGEVNHSPFAESYQEFAVDFETHYVVVVFTGPCTSCAITPRQRGNVVHIGFHAEHVQTEGRDIRTDRERDRDEASCPYAFVVLPKPVRTVIIEKNIQQLLGKPPVWKVQFRFPAPRGK